MKNLLLTILLIILASSTTNAIEIDTLWYRYTGSGNQDVDFTPDDRYVILWRNGIEFWEVQQGVKDFFIPSEALGDYNYNDEYLVFAQDSTPKLLKWKTREVVEGFEKENENIGRIRTAKSKNEFMANTYHVDTKSSTIIGNTINIYDIESKRKVDSISFVKQFEKDSYKWKRTIHDFDYVGTNDEIIYVEIDDVNDEIENIPAQLRKRHYFVHFYNLQSKELVDSVYLFTNTNTEFGGVNKMQVMNDRSKIAWNNKGGEINFYNFYSKQFYDRIVFDSHDFVEASDIEFNRLESIVGITHGKDLKIYNLQSKELVYYSNIGGKDNISFSNNEELLAAHVNSYLLLFPSHIGTTSVNAQSVISSLTVTPNPASNLISIQVNSESNKTIKLSIIDLVGNEIGIIDKGTIVNQNYSIDYNIFDLPPATYFIRLKVGSEIITQKFIKE